MDMESYYNLQKTVFELREKWEDLKVMQDNKEQRELHLEYLKLKNQYLDLLESTSYCGKEDAHHLLKSLPTTFISVPIGNRDALRQRIEQIREIIAQYEGMKGDIEIPLLEQQHLKDLANKRLTADVHNKQFSAIENILTNTAMLFDDGSNKHSILNGNNSIQSQTVGKNHLQVMTNNSMRSDSFNSTVKTFCEESVLASSPILKVANNKL